MDTKLPRTFSLNDMVHADDQVLLLDPDPTIPYGIYRFASGEIVAQRHDGVFMRGCGLTEQRAHDAGETLDLIGVYEPEQGAING